MRSGDAITFISVFYHVIYTPRSKTNAANSTADGYFRCNYGELKVAGCLITLNLMPSMKLSPTLPVEQLYLFIQMPAFPLGIVEVAVQAATRIYLSFWARCIILLQTISVVPQGPADCITKYP